MKVFSHLGLMAIATVATLASAFAQAPVQPPAKLAEFREAFEKAVDARSAPARAEFGTALDQLVRDRVVAADYEGAIRARDRARELRSNNALGSDNDDASGPDDEVVVDIASGSRSGSGLKYDAKDEKIIGLGKTSQSIRWELSRTEPGTYSAIVTYSCGEPETDELGATTPTGGTFTLSETTGLSTTNSKPLSRDVTHTGGWNRPITRNIGRLVVTGRSLTLQLSVTKANEGGLMHLYGIRLVPVPADLQPGTPAGVASPPELTALRSKFQATVTGRISGIVMSYGTALRQLREKLTEANEIEAAYEVQQEFIAASKLADEPTLIVFPSDPPSPTEDENDPELSLLEATYGSALKDIQQDLGTKWLTALSSLRDELTREIQFPQALLVRGEEERVKAMLEGDPLPASSSTPLKKITLLPRDASVGEAAEYRIENSHIALPEIGASASWKLPKKMTAGTYEVILHFRSGNHGGGSYEIGIDSDQTITDDIVPTPEAKGSWKKKRTRLAGEVSLDSDSGNLTVTFKQNLGSAALMNLHSIDLAAPGTWADMQSGDEASADPPREFEKLEGARWVDSETRQPGEFIVSHKDEQHTFRLYFVGLPPAEMPTRRLAKDDLARAAKRLRTTEEKILRFGKKVDAGLRDMVWSENLTIYTRWETRGRGTSYFAFILVGDTPISLTLVENGQARSGGSVATQVPFLDRNKGSSRAYSQSIRAAESKARSSRRGLWGL